MDSTCNACDGKGYKLELDIMAAKNTKKICEKCKGTGVIQEAPQEGSIFFIQKCEVGYWQELRNGKPVATLHIHVCPMFNPGTMKMLVKRDPNNPLAAIPRLFIQIINMNTKIKYRKCGIMSKLLEKALADPKIESAETSWDDSTADGRNFLIGKGFVQEGDKLIWRRPDAT